MYCAPWSLWKTSLVSGILCAHATSPSPRHIPAELLQQGSRLQREVHVPIPGQELCVFCDDLLAGDFHHISLDVNEPLLPVDIAPLQVAGLAPAHPGGDDEFEVGLAFETLFFQHRDDFLQFCIEIVEVFGTEFRQFIVSQRGQEATDVLLVPGQ